MKVLNRFFHRLRNFLTAGSADERLREEMDFHLSRLTEENLRAGMPLWQARRDARLKFGPVNSIQESYHAEKGMPLVENLLRDLRYSLRQLRRTPGFTLAASMTLALGLGASAGIFSLIDGLWLHPMQVPQPSEIVRLYGTAAQDQDAYFSYPEYQAIARAPAFQSTSGSLIAMGGRSSLMANADGTSTILLNYVVSDNFFSVLRVHPLLGQLFTPADAAELKTRPGVVLGYRCWQHTFGGDPHIVGRTLPLRHGKDRIVPVDVWGVLPSSFRDVDPNSDRDLWD